MESYDNTVQLNKARQLYQAGDLESTVELLEPLVRRYPAESQSLRLLFKAYAEGRQFGRAEGTYRTLLEASLAESQLYALHLDMARVHHAGGQTTKSLEAVEKAISLNPSAREAYDLLVQVHESRNTLATAAETLQRSVVQQPDNADLHSVQAKTYEKIWWWAEARDAATVAIRLKPNMAEPQHILRRVEKQLNSNPRLYQEAARRRQSAGDVEDMLRYWLAWANATQQADDFVTVGELCEQHGQPAKAEYAFNRAIRLQDDHQRAQEGRDRVKRKKQLPIALDKSQYNASELEQLFEWFIYRGDAQGAVSFLRRYLDRYTRFVPALRLLARAYQKTGQFDTAARTFQEAIAKSSVATATADLYCELGNLYLAQGQRDLAKQAFRSALRYAQNHAEAKRQLDALAAAEVPPFYLLRKDWQQFRASGCYEDALKHFQNFLDMDPHRADLYIFMGYAYEKLGRIEQAYQAHKHGAFLIDTDDAFVKLGTFCARNRLYAEANGAFELALKINERNVEARRSLAQIPDWMKSEEKRLQSRTGRPDSQYLYAIWNLSKRKGLAAEAVKYFAALADTMADEPILFSLLGQANEECGDSQAAAVAYRHKAALRGTAEDYVKLGDFCFRHAGLDAIAVAAYQTALALNPFYHHAKSRLAILHPGHFPSPAYITGSEYREDLARDLCESPGDGGKAEKLRSQFLENRAAEYAETTYRTLQKFHPEQLILVQDLAQVYQACGKQPITSVEPVEENVAPTIATDWYLYRSPGTEAQETAPVSLSESVQLAQEHLRKARQASVDDIAQLRLFLAAASLYRYANRLDEAADCLVEYGQAMAGYHYMRGKTDLARGLAIEAMRLAMSRARDFPGQQTILADYILDYLENLEKSFGPLKAWSATVHAESQALLAASRTLASPQLGNFLGLLASFFASVQQPGKEQDFQGPSHHAAVIRRRVGTVLRPREQHRLLEALEHWSADLVQPIQQSANRARLELLIPPILQIPAGTSEVDLKVDVYNSGKIPFDCLRVNLTVGVESKTQERRQFIPFLPDGATCAVTFHLIDIPEQFGYAELKLDLSYFDPIERQEMTIRPVLTLRRPDWPFQRIDNPYRTSWLPNRPFEPDYLPKEQAERIVTGQAQSAGIEWTAAARSAALDTTASERVTLEILCHQVVEHLNQVERTPPRVLTQDIEWVAETMVAQQNNCPHFLALIESGKLSGVDKLILACLAAWAEDATTWVRQDDLLRDLGRWGSRLSADEFFSRAVFMQTRPSLLQAEETLDGSHQYRLTIKLLHAWLRKHWSPDQAFTNLRQLQWEERSRLADVLREKLSKAKAAHQANQEAKEVFDKGLTDLGRFTQLTKTYTGERDALLFEIRGILTDEEYAQTHELLDQVVAGVSEEAIREALETAAQRRGWDETQIRQRLGGNRGEVLDQIARFILDVWTR